MVKGYGDTVNIKAACQAELVVLVVEDHLMFSKDVKHALPEHKVVLARSVEEAKLRYDECLPNITFLDIDLPDGAGFEVLEYIRDKEPDAYVVMATGSKVESDVLVSQKKGARGYIIKPFTKSKIEQHLRQFQEYREKQIKSLLAETTAHRSKELALMPHMQIT